MTKRVIFLMNGWDSAAGGIQTVNRELILALARTRTDLNCTALVTKATEKERESAFRNNVELISGDVQDDWSTVLLSQELAAIDADDVIAIIGHSRFSGDTAIRLRDRFFPSALAAHFIHMDPMRVEGVKEHKKDSYVAEREEKQRQELEIAKRADLVFCVGPRLTRYMKDLFLAHDLPVDRVRRIDCGLSADQKARSARPEEPTVLCLGRTESLGVKGLDIFAYAAGIIHAQWDTNPLTKDIAIKPRFVVRGAEKDPEKLEAELKKMAQEVGGNPTIHVRPYSTDKNDLSADIRGASAFLMPSREEGFGLVACEAMSIGTPIIISAASGVAELIHEIAATTGLALGDCIIDVEGEAKDVAQRFSDATLKLLVDGAADDLFYPRLRGHLASHCSWEKGALTFIDAIEAESADRGEAKVVTVNAEAAEPALAIASPSTIEAVVAAQRDSLLAKQGVVGVGVKHAIIVTIEQGSKPNLPHEIDGFQVIVREIEEIKLSSTRSSSGHELFVNGQHRATVGLFATDFAGNLFAVTVAHAFDRTDVISAEIRVEGDMLPLSIETIDTASDWALLRVPYEPASPSPRLPGRASPGAAVSVELPGSVTPGTVDTVEMTAELTSQGGERLRYGGLFEVVLSEMLPPGASGAVVSGRGGEVLGIVVAAGRRGASNIFALARTAEDFLERHQLRPATIDEPPNQPRIGLLLTDDDVAELLFERLQRVNRFTRSNRIYFRGTTESGARVVCSILRDAGNLASAITMTALLLDNKLDAAFVIGRCGGVQPDQSLRDVVVSSEILLYETGGFGFQVEHVRPVSLGVTSTGLQSLAREVSMEQKAYRIHVGPIASAGSTFASTDDFAAIRSMSRSVLAIDMTAAGALSAASALSSDLPVIVVAEIADLANALKSDHLVGAPHAVDATLRMISRLKVSKSAKRRVLSVGPSGQFLSTDPVVF